MIARSHRLATWFAGAAALSAVCGCATIGGGGSLVGAKGSPWTIRCLELQGPGRFEQIEQVAETLKRTTGVRPNDVLWHDEPDGFARLYYGRYRRRVDPKSGKRPMPAQMRKDLDLLRQLGDSGGGRIFLRAMPVRMPMPDVGNPNWALANVRAAYSLQVAVFEPNDEFWEYKEAADRYCGALREKGYEAYYHHGSASSVVTVGAFGPEAVITKSDGHRRRTYYSSEVLALQRDELLKYNRLNGAVYRVRDDRGAMVRVPSRLVKVPRDAEGDSW